MSLSDSVLNQNDSDSFLEKIHDDTILDPEAWVTKADELLDAAKLLEPVVIATWEKDNPLNKPHIGNIYYMLSAYALENLFKGYLVAINSSKASGQLDRRWSARNIFTHDLVKLAETAGLEELNTKDWQSLLNRLSHNSVWLARYPVPVKPKAIKLSGHVTSLDEHYIVTNISSDSDVTNIARLVDFMKNRISQLIPPPST